MISSHSPFGCRLSTTTLVAANVDLSGQGQVAFQLQSQPSTRIADTKGGARSLAVISPLLPVIPLRTANSKITNMKAALAQNDNTSFWRAAASRSALSRTGRLSLVARCETRSALSLGRCRHSVRAEEQWRAASRSGERKAPLRVVDAAGAAVASAAPGIEVEQPMAEKQGCRTACHRNSPWRPAYGLLFFSGLKSFFSFASSLSAV